MWTGLLNSPPRIIRSGLRLTPRENVPESRFAHHHTQRQNIALRKWSQRRPPFCSPAIVLVLIWYFYSGQALEAVHSRCILNAILTVHHPRWRISQDKSLQTRIFIVEFFVYRVVWSPKGIDIWFIYGRTRDSNCRARAIWYDTVACFSEQYHVSEHFVCCTIYHRSLTLEHDVLPSSDSKKPKRKSLVMHGKRVKKSVTYLVTRADHAK